MTKSIRSYPESERAMVIKRRIAHKSGGLGHWAAIDSEKAIATKKAKKTTEVDSSEPSSQNAQ